MNSEELRTKTKELVSRFPPHPEGKLMSELRLLPDGLFQARLVVVDRDMVEVEVLAGAMSDTFEHAWEELEKQALDLLKNVQPRTWTTVEGSRVLEQMVKAEAHALKERERLLADGWKEDFPDSFSKVVPAEKLEEEKQKLTLSVSDDVPVQDVATTEMRAMGQEIAAFEGKERAQEGLQNLMNDIQGRLIGGDNFHRWKTLLVQDNVLVVEAAAEVSPTLEGERYSIIVVPAWWRYQELWRARAAAKTLSFTDMYTNFSHNPEMEQQRQGRLSGWMKVRKKIDEELDVLRPKEGT